MKKKILLMVVILAAAGTGCYLWQARGQAAAGDGTPKFTEAAVKRGPIREEVACSGSVVSNLDVEIKCKATGQVTEVRKEISDAVEKGELLLQIDPVDEERSVRQAEVRLASAEAKLARAEQSLKVSEQELLKSRMETRAGLTAAQATGREQREKVRRLETLLEKEYASTEEVESAEAAAAQAESAVQKAQAAFEGIKADETRLELLKQDIKLAQADVESCGIDLQNAKQRLLETKVYAPISGIVSERMVEVGQIISSPTMNVGGGSSLLTLSDLSRVFVLANVDESDVGKVRAGQAATVMVDAFPDERFRGEVVRVATKGSKLSNVVTFEVKIEVLDERKDLLLPEMTADVEILADSSDNALLVPSEAVRRRGPERQVLVPAPGGGAPAPVTVTVGMDDGANTEILSGLREGQAILIEEKTAAADKSAQRGGFGGPPPGGGPPPM